MICELINYFVVNSSGDTNIDKKLVEKLNKYYEKYITANTAISVTKSEKMIKFLNKFCNVKEKLDNSEKTNTQNIINTLNTLFQDSHKLFEWVDGPLTESMKKGKLLLIDEISLAQDSVL